MYWSTPIPRVSRYAWLRSHWFLAMFASLVACGRQTDPGGVSDPDRDRTPGAESPIGPSPSAGAKPTGRTEPPLVDECVEDTECGFAAYPDVSAESECACPVCPADAPVVSREEVDRRRRQYVAACRSWAQVNPCPPRACAAPGRPVCSSGHCDIKTGGAQ